MIRRFEPSPLLSNIKVSNYLLERGGAVVS
jgi:hypothetical protein